MPEILALYAIWLLWVMVYMLSPAPTASELGANLAFWLLVASFVSLVVVSIALPVWIIVG